MPNAKRLGLDVKGNIDLDLRLCRIENELDQCVKTYDEGNTSDSKPLTIKVTLIPPVSGFRVTGKTVGTVSFAWDPMPISDLRSYTLWIAENIGFTENLQTFNVPSTEYTFSTLTLSGGSGEATIYAKVRARGEGGNVGPFSSVLSTTVGLVQEDEIANQAVTVEKIVIEYSVDERVWTEANDGPGSGLDADTVDGYHANEMFVPLVNTLNDAPSAHEKQTYESWDTNGDYMNNSSWSVEHSFYAYPRFTQFWLEAAISAGTWVVGDRVPLTTEAASAVDGLNHNIIIPWVNKYEVGYSRSTLVRPYILNRDGSSSGPIVLGRWLFVAELWK